jgi:hypothetical protein
VVLVVSSPVVVSSTLVVPLVVVSVSPVVIGFVVVVRSGPSVVSTPVVVVMPPVMPPVGSPESESLTLPGPVLVGWPDTPVPSSVVGPEVRPWESVPVALGSAVLHATPTRDVRQRTRSEVE